MNANTTKSGSAWNPGPGFRSLLVPVDLTPNSDRVLGRVGLLPLAGDARVTILHVVPESLRPHDLRDAERDAHKALASEVRHLRKSLAKGVRVEPLVTVGTPVKDIGSCAKQVTAELVVMGRGGGRLLRDTFLGSTAERVVRQARLPVLVVRRAPRQVYSRPALALDFDRAAQEVVRLALLVLPPPWPRMAVVHAYDFPYGGLVYPSLAEDEAGGERSELQLQATEKLTTLLAEAVTKLKLPLASTPTWRTHVRYGVTHQRRRDDFCRRGQQARLPCGSNQWQLEERSRTSGKHGGAWRQPSELA